jgi:hypothetical protein
VGRTPKLQTDRKSHKATDGFNYINRVEISRKLTSKKAKIYEIKRVALSPAW